MELLPFTKLYKQARRGSEEDVKLLNELGAYYTSVALCKDKAAAFRERKKHEGNFVGERKEPAP